MFASRPWYLWLLSALLSLLFLVAGAVKLLATPEAVAQFNKFGYPGWFRVLIGAAEQVFGLGLLVPRFTSLSALALGVIMIGAATTQLIYSTPDQAAPPIIILVLLTLLARFTRLAKSS